MQYLYDEVASLDRRCYEEFDLSEDLLMEHAADGMADYIRKHFKKGSSILIATGSGNNGADGITLARLLHTEYEVALWHVKTPKSPMCLLQQKRAAKIGIEPTDKPGECYDIVVDAVLGTGFQGEFNEELRQKMQRLNTLKGYKIACDVPSGLRREGTCESDTFMAQTTLTMGALKKGMFLDEAKEYVGDIHVLDLGVARAVYETPSNWKLLDYHDMTLPYRTKKNTHKGSFGHTAVIVGEKAGAALLAASSALRIGSGLVTLIECEPHTIPFELMRSEHLPPNTTALAIGMGLGNLWSEEELDELLANNLPLVADADILYTQRVKELLQREHIVLTPHPKEFTALLEILEIASVDIATLQKKRFEYVERFCQAYPNATLLLKGANVIIGQENDFFINDKGSSKLAKGGSGDVLAGIIAGLLAQGYTPLEAAKNATLIHTKLSSLYQGNSFSLTPTNLIDLIPKL